MHKSIGAVLVAGICLAVSACGGETSQGGTALIAALKAEQSAKDKLPAHITEAGVDPESTRLAAERDGYAFYLAIPAEVHGADEACVVIENLKDETGWMTACSTIAGNIPMVGQIRGVSASVVPDNYDATTRIENGWQQIHENLLVMGL